MGALPKWRPTSRRPGGGGLCREKIEGMLGAARQTLGMPCIAAERVLLQTLA
jgi:hypothetical protein